ncbi:MAG TPA: ATP-binding protein [Chthonomonadaceae bacterium]|nr:ATP-binding protein [Chthonomonadaceae bacterium]
MFPQESSEESNGEGVNRRHLEFLAEADAILVSSLDYETTLTNVAHLAVPKLGDWCAVDILESSGAIRSLAVAHVDPAKVALARTIRQRYPPDPNAPTGVPNVLRTGKTERRVEIPDSLLEASVRDPEQLRLIRELGLKSYMCVPLVARGRTLGAITLISAESGRRYTAQDQKFAEDLARRAALAVDNARLYREVQTQRRRLDAILASVPGVVWEAWGQPDDATQRIDFVSDYVEKMLGYSVEEWLTTPNFWLTIVHPEDKARAAQEAAATFASGRPGINRFRWIAKDGRVLWVESQSTIIRDETGAPIGMRGVTMDITERKEAEENLRRRALELARMARALERSNQELDQFAYITSHDLRAPLRGIANLSRWIEEDLGENLTEETRQQLELMRGRVNRMEAMIEGILEYSRVGRVAIKLERVDVGALLSEIVDLLAPPPGFTVEIAPGMPVLVTKKIRLQQVFQNLIGNALKHHHRPEGHIRVSVQDAGEFYEFAVTDDGPGIAPQYHDKVFVIFQTLEARDKVENTGLGLSLVKKIVESQGGTICLESAEGAGATFRFTWPKLPEGGE